MPVTPCAILFGYDEMLNLTRRWILERVGWVVFTAKTDTELNLFCKQHEVQLIVLCYTLMPLDRETVLAKVAAGGHTIKILWLRAHGLSAPSFIPNGALLTSDGPHELYLAARHLAESLREDDEAG